MKAAFVLGANAQEVEGLNTLKYCKDDVALISEALVSSHSGFNVEKLDSSQSAYEIIKQFENYANTVKAGDTLLFHFSGHGYLKRGQLYLVIDSSDLRNPVSTCIPVTLLKTIFSNSAASVRIMVLDCCHSGGAAEGVFYKQVSQKVSDTLAQAAQAGASLVLAACGKTSIARELDSLKNGYLTSKFASALMEDFSIADRDQDGLLSLQDLMGWLNDETIRHNEANVNEQVDMPELYGDMRGDVYFTSEPLGEYHEFKENLESRIRHGVEKIRAAFSEHAYIEPSKLQNLARPIKQAAPTLIDLSILETLFEQGDDAAIFAAATILKVRTDPRYMNRLIKYVDTPYSKLRGASHWRVLWAIRDTIKYYEFSEAAITDLKKRLKKASTIRKTKHGDLFHKGFTLTMIVQVAKKLNIDLKEIFNRKLYAEYLKSGT